MNKKVWSSYCNSARRLHCIRKLKSWNILNLRTWWYDCRSII